MNDSIIKLRERLVELSTDPIETRKLLDQLVEAEIDKENAECQFHVGKKDIVETKDLDFAQLHKTKNGYLLHYHGGYSVLVDDKLISTASSLQYIMDGVPSEVTDEEEKLNINAYFEAIEMIFRLPQFVLSHPETTINIAMLGLKYMQLLQQMGEVPTPETDNPEYDKYLIQINEMMNNYAEGFKKEAKEYQRRMGYAEEKSESESKGESKAEA